MDVAVPRCQCGGEIKPFRRDSFPVPLAACIKCGREKGPWPDVVKEVLVDKVELLTLRDSNNGDFIYHLRDISEDGNIAICNGRRFQNTFLAGRTWKVCPECQAAYALLKAAGVLES